VPDRIAPASGRPWLVWAAAAVALVLAVACAAPTERAADRSPEVPFLDLKLGGDTTAKALRGRPYNQSARNLTNAQLRTFGAGANTFDADMVEPELGPAFNSNSCLGCHHDGLQGDVDPDQPPGLLVRVSMPGEDERGVPLPEPTYGLQLQTDGPAGEGTVTVTYEPVEHRWADGSTSTIHRIAAAMDLRHGPLAPGALTSLRMAPPIVGLGLLEAIPDEELVAAADPDDADGDGISGRVNRVWDQRLGTTVIGRFGWKAGQPTVHQQTVVALHDDMGITTSDVPDTCAHQGSACRPAAEPIELDDADLADLVFYNRTIAVPIARDAGSTAVRRGAALFEQVGCASCHTPTHTAGDDPVAAVAGQTFHAYTDLLLHDMGPGLADGRPEFLASGSEWRTAPLWGLSRRKEVTGSPALLHDGRARNVTEAILWHGGEASAARRAFERLSKPDRRDLLAFLGSL